MKTEIRHWVLTCVSAAALVAAVTGNVCAAAAPSSPSTIPLRLSDDMTAMPAVSEELYRLGEAGNVYSPIDSVGLYAGLNFDVASVIAGYTLGAYDGVSSAASPFYSPYFFLTGSESPARVGVMLADGLRFNFGRTYHSGLNAGLRRSHIGWTTGPQYAADPRGSATLLAGLDWDFAKWGGVSLSAAQTTVRDRALGNAASALDLARISALGVSAHVGFGSGWVTSVSYNQASMQLSLNPGVAGEAGLRSQSYGIAVAKQGLFGHDALGLSLSRPTGTYHSAQMTGEMQFQFYGRDKLFANATPETDIELGYITSILDGPVALQANAGYQMNYNGQNKDSLTFMSRAKIKF